MRSSFSASALGISDFSFGVSSADMQRAGAR
jgi:hypothetical protein